MRILIIGSDFNTYAVAKKMSEQKNVDLVFVAPGNKYIKDFATSVDIQENEIEELLEFATANEINLVFISSINAISNSIADAFIGEGFNVFGPYFNSARITLSAASAKKFMYKLRISTPKFGIFDKEGLAIDYVRASKYPMVIKPDFFDETNFSQIVYTFSKAKEAVERLFDNFCKKIVIEEYAERQETYIYYITDGITVFYLGSVFEEFDLDSGCDICYSPNPNLSETQIQDITKRVVEPTILEISKNSNPYSGIFSVKISNVGKYLQVLEFKPFFNKNHACLILPFIEDDICDLFSAVAVGSFSDDYSDVKLNDGYVYACSNFERNDFDSDLIELSYSNDSKFAASKLFSTLNNAKKSLFGIEFNEIGEDYF